MIAAHVVTTPILERRSPPPISSTGWPVMVQLQLDEASALPTKHVCLNFVHRVAAWSDPKPSQGIPASPLVDLHATADVKCRTLFKDLPPVLNRVQISAPDS